jgi:aspartyl-tRNA(Asn)/glutamyl-tRNA(Gln) amidotransferase subunit C
MPLNTGKELERLVERLERLLVPSGFVVSTNQRILDTDGVQLAEFDIEVRGRIGRQSVNWLIECRDRPSEGPAPSSWIEQLVGRRAIHSLDNVIAVSTTGFSEPAARIAKKSGIVLRRVDAVSDIAADFKVVGFMLYVCEVGSGSINVDAPNSSAAPNFEFRFRDLLLRPEGSSDPVRFVDFVCRDLPPPGDGVERQTQSLEVVYRQPIELLLAGRSIRCNGFRAVVEVDQRLIAGQGLIAKHYSQHNRVIGQEGLFTWVEPEGSIRARVSVVARDDGMETCQVDFLGQLPETWHPTELTIYGRSKLDKATVAHIATLARIKLPEAEQENLANELSHILHWIEQLDEVDTNGVEPMASVADLRLPMRDDVVTDGDCRDKILANAPAASNGFFTVPKVVE